MSAPPCAGCQRGEIMAIPMHALTHHHSDTGEPPRGCRAGRRVGDAAAVGSVQFKSEGTARQMFLIEHLPAQTEETKTN